MCSNRLGVRLSTAQRCEYECYDCIGRLSMHCWDSHLPAHKARLDLNRVSQHNWCSSHTPAPSEQQVHSKVSLRRAVDAV
jgi:hypothetical protein